MHNEKTCVPPIKIQGIKTKIVPVIRECVTLNDNTVWVEPFMGSGVVGFNMRPRQAVFSDSNPYLVAFYNGIKERTITSAIVRAFLESEGRKLEQGDSDYYYEVRDRFNRAHDPLDFLFLNRACFNGMIRFNRNNEFNVPYGHKPQRFSKAYTTKIVNQVKHIEELVSANDWVFRHQSFEDALTELPPNAFIYCDPPYIGRHVDYYDSWDVKDEYRLCELLKQTQARFLLSTWDHNQYRKNRYIDEIWNFCQKINVDHFYHVGAKETNRNPMVEALLTNY